MHKFYLKKHIIKTKQDGLEKYRYQFSVSTFYFPKFSITWDQKIFKLNHLNSNF